MPKKVQRANSNVFAMFEKKQIEEFKEAFGLIDKNSDGKIDDKELRACFEELGRNVKESECKNMVAEVDGPVNFNAFLKLFGEKLSGTDEEQMLFEAFKLMDNSGAGTIHKDELKELLTHNGRPADRLTDSEFKQAMEGCPADRSGNIDYAAFTRLIKNGKSDDE